MNNKRVEYVFNNIHFMADIRAAMPAGSSLRDIQTKIGIQPSTLSRIDNGAYIDIKTLLSICSSLDLSPGDYFVRRIWELKDNE